MDVHQTQRLALEIEDGDLVQSLLSHQPHGVAHKIVNRQMERLSGHYIAHGPGHAIGILSHEAAEVRVGEDARKTAGLINKNDRPGPAIAGRAFYVRSTTHLYRIEELDR